MADILATVATSNNVTVSAVGIQGPSGAATTISSISDVDAGNTVDGSILVFKQLTSKWTATTILDNQDMEGGEF